MYEFSAQKILCQFLAEYGDYNPEEHDENYLSDFRIIPIQSPAITRRIAELHRLHRGQNPADAEFNFLDHAKRLELYGFDIYEAKVYSTLDKTSSIV
jgi:tyrosine-protein phosphatase non-receptor type 4